MNASTRTRTRKTTWMRKGIEDEGEDGDKVEAGKVDDHFEDEDDDKVEAGKDDDDVWSAATVEASRCQQGRSAR